jgi:transposase
MKTHHTDVNQIDINNEKKPLYHNNADFFINIDLPNVDIIDVERDENGYYTITLENLMVGTDCSKCGCYTDNFKKWGRERTIRDLSIFNCPVFLKFTLPIYKCERCGKHNTQRVDWCKVMSSNTLRFEEHVLRQLINSTVQDVAKKESITYDTVLGIMKRHINGEVNWSHFDIIPTIGIDEIANLKGHREYFVIITARIDGDNHIIKVLPDRKKKTVKFFLETIPERLKHTVRRVCTDMYDGYINAVKEVFNKKSEKVKIVIDRFHVAKNYRKCVDDLRKPEMKRLKEELNKEEYDKLKNVHWTLRKNRKDLNPEDIKQLNYLFSHSPLLKQAYKLSNDLTDIFDKHISRTEAKKRIENWIETVNNSSLTIFKTFIKTLKKYFYLIINYFISRANSGFVEGLNNKLKVIKRSCYGIGNVENFFRRIFLSLDGYRLYG